MKVNPPLAAKITQAIDRRRLLDTAVALVAVPSRTGEAGPALDRLAEILKADGFAVERPAGGYSQAPAVAVRLSSGRPGKIAVVPTKPALRLPEKITRNHDATVVAPR